MQKTVGMKLQNVAFIRVASSHFLASTTLCLVTAASIFVPARKRCTAQNRAFNSYGKMLTFLPSIESRLSL